MVTRLLPQLLELLGLALLVYAGWQVSSALGTALAGLALLNYAYLGGRPRP